MKTVLFVLLMLVVVVMPVMTLEDSPEQLLDEPIYLYSGLDPVNRLDPANQLAWGNRVMQISSSKGYCDMPDALNPNADSYLFWGALVQRAFDLREVQMVDIWRVGYADKSSCGVNTWVYPRVSEASLSSLVKQGKMKMSETYQTDLDDVPARWEQIPSTAPYTGEVRHARFFVVKGPGSMFNHVRVYYKP